MAPEPGYTIAFASFAPLNTDIFVADANGRDPKPHNASFSSDGKWIVFTSQREGTADIYRVHPDGSGLKRLVADPAFDDQGSLSPNGKFLAFVSSRSGQADIWVLELATRKPPRRGHVHPQSAGECKLRLHGFAFGRRHLRGSGSEWLEHRHGGPWRKELYHQCHRPGWQ